MSNTLIKGLVCLYIPVAILLYPVPAGLSPEAWQLFAFYIGAIAGLVLRPMPEPVVLLAAMAGISVFFKKTTIALAGFASPTAWLVFSAFLVGQCFVETGLGRRIAYFLIGKMGRTPLSLGYVAAITDAVLSPATPSNTARTAGLVFPIFQSVVITLDSKPGESARRIGSYIMLMLYQASLVTSCFFITANANHALTLSFAKSVMKTEITWMQWAVAMVPPGLILLAVVPWLVYKLYPPTLTEINNKEIAAEGLKEIGPMTVKEKTLAALFVLAILGWATGSITKIDTTAVAITFMTSCLLTGVVSWNALLKSQGAWSTFIWYAGIISFADGLARAKFFDWLGKQIGASMNFAGMDSLMVLLGILAISVVVRYFFASSAAYVSSFMPVLMTFGLAANLSPVMLTFILAASSMLASLLTHYGNGAGPVLFGAGYVDQATWWKNGHIIAVFGLAVYLLIGLPLWKVMGIW